MFQETRKDSSKQKRANQKIHPCIRCFNAIQMMCPIITYICYLLRNVKCAQRSINIDLTVW